ncbi:MAG: hypothetical protein WCD82_04475, partial [Xanthobacteraceae bacterium]
MGRSDKNGAFEVATYGYTSLAGMLSRLSVLRQPADTGAPKALCPPGVDMAPLRDELVARFMVELTRNWYEMHPVLRETVRS